MTQVLRDGYLFLAKAGIVTRPIARVDIPTMKPTPITRGNDAMEDPCGFAVPVTPCLKRNGGNVRIGNLDIGPGHPCAIVAELSGNHNGSLPLMLRLMRAAKEAGASALKIQAYLASELVALRGDGPAPEPWGSQGFTMEKLYSQNCTPLDWLPTVFAYARELEVPLFASVFGPTSLEALLDCDCPALKIAHLDAMHEGLAESVLRTGLPVIVSVSAPNKLAVAYGEQVTQLYCPGMYPARLSQLAFSRITFGDGAFLGFSCHCRAPVAMVAAVARGAKLVEAHFMLGKEPSALESNVSLDEKEFASRVILIRETEQAL
jgi:pseudaminic acid synthase